MYKVESFLTQMNKPIFSQLAHTNNPWNHLLSVHTNEIPNISFEKNIYKKMNIWVGETECEDTEMTRQPNACLWPSGVIQVKWHQFVLPFMPLITVPDDKRRVDYFHWKLVGYSRSGLVLRISRQDYFRQMLVRISCQYYFRHMPVAYFMSWLL